MNGFDRRRQVLAIALAGLAGFIDAAGFLAADGYFVSFMSGNTTRLGVNLAAAPQVAGIPALLICGFVVGVAAGSVVAIRAGTRRKPAVLALVCALLMGAALARDAGLHAATLGLLVLAMGALNATFQRGGEVAVGLTYMTGALVRLGQALAGYALGERRNGWAPFIALWCGLAVGAVLGAFAWSHVAVAALWLGAGWALAMMAFSLTLE